MIQYLKDNICQAGTPIGMWQRKTLNFQSKNSLWQVKHIQCANSCDNIMEGHVNIKSCQKLVIEMHEILVQVNASCKLNVCMIGSNVFLREGKFKNDPCSGQLLTSMSVVDSRHD